MSAGPCQRVPSTSVGGRPSVLLPGIQLRIQSDVYGAICAYSFRGAKLAVVSAGRWRRRACNSRPSERSSPSVTPATTAAISVSTFWCASLAAEPCERQTARVEPALQMYVESPRCGTCHLICNLGSQLPVALDTMPRGAREGLYAKDPGYSRYASVKVAPMDADRTIC